jgi:hypothetical protein
VPGVKPVCGLNSDQSNVGSHEAEVHNVSKTVWSPSVTVAVADTASAVEAEVGSVL